MAAKKLYHRIGETCKILDIQPYVLRYWETEFPALAPDKSRSGQRVYSEEDIDTIRRIKELLYDEGYTIAGAKKKLEAERSSGRGASAAKPASPKSAAAEEDEADATPKEEEKEAARKAKDKEEADAKERRDAREKARAESRKKVVAEASATPGEIDEAAQETIRQLRAGIEQALSEAREILAMLQK